VTVEASLGAHIGALAGVALAAWLAVRIPRRLFTEAGEGAPDRKLEWGLFAVLAAVGLAVLEAMVAMPVSGRLVLALCAVVLAAVVYADVTYLVIPDLYSAVLLVAGLAAPWRLPLVDALIGAAIAGALLLALALAWKRLTKVEGLGYGDVKLAAAIGALLGAQTALLAISLSAALAALLVYALRLARGREVAPLVPYGAALSLACAGFLGAGFL
jgi:leader peptidase (prepilin peptidase)/N-methyltransferase